MAGCNVGQVQCCGRCRAGGAAVVTCRVTGLQALQQLQKDALDDVYGDPVDAMLDDVG
jgi:hypothetical protein